MKFFSGITPVIFAALATAQQPIYLLDILRNTPELSSLSDILQPYLQQFESLQDITLLAPNNDAVGEFLNSSAGAAVATQPELLQAILSYHILNGTYQTFSDMSFIPTLLQPPMYANVTGGQVVQARSNGGTTTFISGLVQNSTAVGGVQNFTRGCVQEVDRFLTIPQNVTTTGVALNLTSAVGALEALNMTSIVEQNRNITVFLPSNAAFRRVGGTLASLSTSELKSIISYHIVEANVAYSPSCGCHHLSFTTANSSELTMGLQSDGVYVNNAKIIRSDVLVTNGVIHVIDRLLNPAQSTLTPNPSTTQDAFNAIAATDDPFTSFVPTSTSAVPAGSTSPSGSTYRSRSHANVVAITGGVVGGVVGLVLIILAIWFCKRKGYSLSVTKKIAPIPDRTVTTTSYRKSELPVSEAKGPAEVTEVMSSEIPTPSSKTRTELSAEERLRAEFVAAGVGQSQQQSSAELDSGWLQAHQKRLAELENEKRMAELDYEHQTRMAWLEHEKRMAELSISGEASRVRSQGEISELEAAAGSTTDTQYRYNRQEFDY